MTCASRAGWAVAVLGCVPASELMAQMQPLSQQIVGVAVDSGWVQNLGDRRAVIFSTLVQADGAPWIRLKFDDATLGQTPRGGQPTILRMTSVTDGAVQLMQPIHVTQWRNTSAYFNGDAVVLEIIADPNAPASHLAMSQVWTGVVEDGGIATICGPNDDRVLSSDPRACRLFPVGCTGWIITDSAHCFLTAGHCAGGSLDVCEFNVPLSSAGGALNHPPPEDQYSVDLASDQFVNGGLGNDWCYFGCFPNSNTNLTPFQAQGDAYALAAAAPGVENPPQPIRITGYGVDSTPPQNNQVQQTNAGPYVSLSGTTLSYQADTTGGNSGSAVLDESTQLAIGIHTNGGCNAGGGSNKGCAIQNTGLQNALDNPIGVCIPVPSLTFNFPDGIPTLLDPAGDTVRVEVNGSGGGVPQENTGTFAYDDGSGFVAAPMEVVSPNVYDAIVPPIACGTTVKFYFSAQTTKNETVYSPELAPADSHDALVALAVQTSFTDDFNNSVGWIVTNSPGLTTGAWQIGAPIAGGDQNDPPADGDGSGRCFVTQNLNGDFDVDGGSTTVTSPAIDASASAGVLNYFRWFSSSASADDSFVVEVSDDDGASWIVLETIAAPGANAWTQKSWPIHDIAGIDPSAQFRVRFTVTDGGAESVVEGGLDGASVAAYECGSPSCLADIVASTVVDVDDLLAVINAWGPCANPTICPEDVSPSGGNDVIDVDDLLVVINGWGPCP